MFKEILIYISVYIGLFAVSYFFLSFILSKKRAYSPILENELPKVSIIIPAYNEEKGIKGTIYSALNLEYPKEKFEVIVVDDGSRDNTFLIASKIKDRRLKVFKEENRGKATALNYAIAKCKGEIIITMDADSFAEKDALIKMVQHFSNPKVMCVAPSMAIYNPKGILQRIQQVEYLLGVYLRKAFSSMNAVHITPGAFSAYRNSFFKKYGGFDVGNVTEDLEMALRIQYNNFAIEVEDKAVVYTECPNKFLVLTKQRRRWYFGLTKNLWHYRGMFSKRYGQLGTIVLPVAVIGILLSTFLTSYIVIDSLLRLKKELNLLESISFDLSFIKLNSFVFERFFFIFFSNPNFLFLVLFVLIVAGYMMFAKSRVKKYSSIGLSVVLFFLLYSFLFAFWWIVSLFYTIFIGKTSWGKK